MSGAAASPHAERAGAASPAVLRGAVHQHGERPHATRDTLYEEEPLDSARFVSLLPTSTQSRRRWQTARRLAPLPHGRF